MTIVTHWPKVAFQLFGGILSFFSLYRGGRQMYQSLLGLSRELRDSLNHECYKARGISTYR